MTTPQRSRVRRVTPDAPRGTSTTTKQASSKRKPAAPVILERDFQRQVIELARRCGWRVFHCYGQGSVLGSRAIDAGFPDLVLVRAGQILMVELKGSRGRVSEEQDAWLHDIQQCGIPALVWYPRDWDDAVAILTAAPKSAWTGGAA